MKVYFGDLRLNNNQQKGGDYTMKRIACVFLIILTMLCSTVTSFASKDPNVILVNPASNSIVYSNNLLISVKITQPKIIRVTFYQEMQMVNGTPVAVSVSSLTNSAAALNNANITDVAVTSPAIYTSTNNLSFFTQKHTGLSPGVYKIKIDTLDSSWKELYSTSSLVIVKEKSEKTEDKILDSPQSGTMQFLQNILETIFGD